MNIQYIIRDELQQTYVSPRSKVVINISYFTCVTVTTTRSVFRLGMEETAFRYGG